MLNTFAFYLIVGTEFVGNHDLLEVVECAVDHGVTAVQLREKSLSTKSFIEIGKELKQLLSPKDIPLIINDRIDVALAIKASGVHIGQSDMNAMDARKILGKDLIIGLTVETLEEAHEAQHLPIDYLGLSSLFSTPTKPEAEAYWSQDRIQKLKRITATPLVGIGGINLKNIAEVLSYGIDGVALSSEICLCSNFSEMAHKTKNLSAIIQRHYEK